MTPEQRHSGLELRLLSHRKEVYERARSEHPERWSGRTRNWDPIEIVELNPEKENNEQKVAA